MIGLTNSYASLAVESIVVGSIATLVADLWSRLLQTVVGIPRANWGLVGRWVTDAGPACDLFRSRLVFLEHGQAEPACAGAYRIGSTACGALSLPDAISSPTQQPWP